MSDDRLLLTDESWAKIAAELARRKSRRGTTPDLSDRDFVEAVLHLARTGEPWRDLPKRFGQWQALYRRFRRWLARGFWRGLLRAVPAADLERLTTRFIDSTVVRAHQHAAGARKKTADKRRRGSAAAAAV